MQRTDLSKIRLTLLAGVAVSATLLSMTSYSAAQTVASSSGSQTVETVVVSAEKKNEDIQDVPVPVTVLAADSLAETNQTKLRDYFSSAPGLNLSPGPSAGSQQMLTIRGISAGSFGNPTVGVTVDDVPYGAFTREYAPDIDPSDLQRVEVLRGPQGTLYGANSMGGLVKFVTVDPSTDGFSGRLEAGLDGVYNGAEPGFALRGSVNVPLADDFAIRASAFTRQDAGYIDNPVLGKSGVNEVHASGGRISGLWHLSDTFTLKVSGLYQETIGDGLPEVVKAPGLGDLQQNYIPNTGQYKTSIQAYSATLNGKLGIVDLTSVTGFNVYDYHTVNDYTFLIGANAKKFFGVTGGAMYADGSTRKFTEELRAALPIGDRVDLLLGGFFTHENTPLIEHEQAEDPATGQIPGTILSFNIPIQLTEFAAFGDATIHFTDNFDIQVGGRESFLLTDFKAVTEGGAIFPTPLVVPEIRSKPTVFTYLITPEYKVSPDLMIYARIASGYRPSRANTFNSDPNIPRTAQPDKTTNYEVGAKGSLFDNMLTFDASLYYIDWTDIQILLQDTSNGLTYYTNGAGAKSEGVELSVTTRPWAGLTLGSWVSYDDAQLTDGFPANTAAYGPAGARLPFSGKWSANLTAQQNFQLTNDVSGFVGTTFSYIGSRQGTFVATAARGFYPDYGTVDLRTGVEFNNWSMTLYANNVGDTRGALGGGPGNYPPTAYVYVQPRTVGVTVARTF